MRIYIFAWEEFSSERCNDGGGGYEPVDNGYEPIYYIVQANTLTKAIRLIRKKLGKKGKELGVRYFRNSCQGTIKLYRGIVRKI